MNTNDVPTPYLDLYRQQLRQQTEAMGYNRRPLTTATTPKRRPRSQALTGGLIVAAALVALGLLGAPI